MGPGWDFWPHLQGGRGDYLTEIVKNRHNLWEQQTWKFWRQAVLPSGERKQCDWLWLHSPGGEWKAHGSNEKHMGLLIPYRQSEFSWIYNEYNFGALKTQVNATKCIPIIHKCNIQYVFIISWPPNLLFLGKCQSRNTKGHDPHSSAKQQPNCTTYMEGIYGQIYGKHIWSDMLLFQEKK